VWKQHLQIEDVVLAPPYSSVGAPTGAYLGDAGGDALRVVRTQVGKLEHLHPRPPKRLPKGFRARRTKFRS
jgi:hypothetical protein